jgi:DNA-binding XRE family transcriptional regulator
MQIILQNLDNEKHSLATRLKSLIENNQYSINQFAKALGHDRSQTLQNAVSGRVWPSCKLLIDIAAEFPDTDFNWLIKGLTYNNELATQSLNEPNAQVDDYVAMYEKRVNSLELMIESQQLEIDLLKKRKQ